jgi:hypothetical protein
MNTIDFVFCGWIGKAQIDRGASTTQEPRLSPCSRRRVSTTQHSQQPTICVPVKVKVKESPGAGVLVYVPLLNPPSW